MRSQGEEIRRKMAGWKRYLGEEDRREWRYLTGEGRRVVAYIDGRDVGKAVFM